MKNTLIGLILLLISSNALAIGDIKPTEIKETVIVGGGPTISSSMRGCYKQIYDSCKQVQSVSNRNSQPVGYGWVTTMTVKYKVVH
jgi:hypothetical protein